jgi:putative ABC transport system permease protein
VAIIDDTLAKRLFPNGEDPLGQYVQTWKNDPGFTPEPLEIVGVVPSLRQDLFDPAPTPHLYVPFSLKPRTWMNYHARVAAGGPGEGAMLEQIRREIRAYDERLPILTTKTLRAFVADSVFLWVFRSGARIFTVFGVAALLLALVGIYGVNAYVVARRTREIGIRMALGATSGDVLRLVLRESAMVTAVGIAAGTAMAIGIGTALQSMLYEVTAFDPVALVAVPILLAASTLAASYVPARRAARVAPVSALRYE